MHPQMEKFLKIPFYQRLLILLVAMAVISGAFFYLLFLPKLNSYKDLVKKSESLQGKILEDKQIADNLGKYRSEFDKMQIRLQEALKELPNDKEIPTLLTSIASIANQNNLDVKKFQPNDEVPKGFYAEVPVSLILLGGYHQLGKFFYDISEMSRIVNIGNLKIKTFNDKSAGDKVVLMVDCQAVTYRFLKADEAQAKKPARGAKKK